MHGCATPKAALRELGIHSWSCGYTTTAGSSPGIYPTARHLTRPLVSWSNRLVCLSWRAVFSFRLIPEYPVICQSTT